MRRIRRDEGLHRVESPLQIGVEHRRPVLLLHPHQQAVAGHAGIVDEDVDGAEVGNDLFAKFLHRLVIGHVDRIGPGAAGKGQVDLARGLAAARFIAADHRDLRPLGGKCHGDRSADPAATPGDHDCLSCKALHGETLRRRDALCQLGKSGEMRPIDCRRPAASSPWAAALCSSAGWTSSVRCRPCAARIAGRD